MIEAIVQCTVRSGVYKEIVSSDGLKRATPVGRR